MKEEIKSLKKENKHLHRVVNKSYETGENLYIGFVKNLELENQKN